MDYVVGEITSFYGGDVTIRDDDGREYVFNRDEIGAFSTSNRADPVLAHQFCERVCQPVTVALTSEGWCTSEPISA
jgi:hypothetical protein